MNNTFPITADHIIKVIEARITSLKAQEHTANRNYKTATEMMPIQRHAQDARDAKVRYTELQTILTLIDR